MILMRIRFPKLNQASTLAVILLVCIVICVALASYLSFAGSRNVITMRSAAWNNAIPALESGIEEALAHLHADSTNFTANNWAAVQSGGQTIYQKRRDLPDGTYCVVSISNAAFAPVIYSKGFVPSPLDPATYIS